MAKLSISRSPRCSVYPSSSKQYLGLNVSPWWNERLTTHKVPTTPSCLCWCSDCVLFSPLVFSFFFLSFISGLFVQSSLAHQPIELWRLPLIVHRFISFVYFRRIFNLLEALIYHIFLRADMQSGNWWEPWLWCELCYQLAQLHIVIVTHQGPPQTRGKPHQLTAETGCPPEQEMQYSSVINNLNHT